MHPYSLSLSIANLNVITIKSILLMQWSVQSYGCRVAYYLYELFCKNSVALYRLQICTREREQGWNHLTLQKSVKIYSHGTHCTKMEFVWPKTHVSETPMHCSCHVQ